MERRLPISKPLLLVLIGLIIGASLGLGSGYAVFYPNMVNERSRTIEEQVADVEDSVDGLGVRLDSMNQSMVVIGASLDGILTLTEVIEGISERVTAIENGQVTLNSELDDVEDTLGGDLDDVIGTLNQINEDFVDLTDDWDEVVNDFTDLETAYYAANNELESIQDLVRENDGIRIYTSYMANPSSGFKQDISDAIYAQLILENQDFGDYVALLGTDGETTAKIFLIQEVDSMMGGLVWNPTDNTEVGSESYQVKLETYFRFQLATADITVDKMHLEIRATVNIDTEAISGKQVSLVEIM
jgi:uncharacterized phage infection (PIP) family protein YhgE